MSTCIARRNPGAWKPRVLAALLAAAAAAAGFAGNRDFWRFETSEDFLAGESEGVSIGPEGPGPAGARAARPARIGAAFRVVPGPGRLGWGSRRRRGLRGP